MNTIDILLGFGAGHLLVSALLFAIAVVVARLRPLDAEHRSWLLLAALVLAVVLPFASFLPDWASTSPAWQDGSHSLAPLPEEGARADEAVYEAGQRRDTMYVEVPRSTSSLLVLAWLLGTLWQWMRLAEGWRESRRLLGSARREPALETSLARELSRGSRIFTTITDGPMVVGLLRPCILVPRELVQRLAHAALQDVLRHEIAHIRRGDLWWSALARGAMAVFWWNPLLHAINARLELAREMACDARAARGRDARADYADSLLCSAEAMFRLGAQRDSLAVGMFGHRGHLARRIDGLIGDEPRIGSLPRRGATALGVFALTACCGLAIAAVPRVTLPDDAAEPDARVVALLAAARDGDRDGVRRLVAEGADVDARVLEDGTALIQAVRSRDLATVDALLELGADPNRASLGEGNPLIVASGLGVQPIVERLVAAGADVNRIVTYDETPLINAARGGHLATVRFLVARGADVNLGVEADGWLGRWRTPLNQARDPAVRAYLVEHGARDARR